MTLLPPPGGRSVILQVVTPTFPDHLERILGELEGGQPLSPPTGRPSMHAVRFPDQPFEGAATYMTLGLSKVLLELGDDHVRLELLTAQAAERERWEAASGLADVAERAAELGLAVHHGQVFGPAGPVVPDSPLEAYVAVTPGFHPEALERFEDPDGGVPIRVLMLLPITKGEAAYVRQHGVDAFETLLVERDPDVFDWRRSSFIDDAD